MQEGGVRPAPPARASARVPPTRNLPRLDGRDLGFGPALVPGAATDLAEKTSLSRSVDRLSRQAGRVIHPAARQIS